MKIKSRNRKRSLSNNKDYNVLDELGEGKDGIVYDCRKNNIGYAMKTFSRRKSIKNITKECELQKRASEFQVAPKIIQLDIDNRFIVMEKMDHHLYDDLKKQQGLLTKKQQEEIIHVFEKLDDAKVFQGDSNLMNYMYDTKGGLCMIDFGMGKKIDRKLCDKLGTQTPNLSIMNLGFILKLKDLQCPRESYEILLEHITPEVKTTFGLV